MAHRYSYLSYVLNDATPLYGGAQTLQFRSDKAIARGDSSNTQILTFPNHSGTHIDFPYHFSEDGKTLNDYPPEFWIFRRPVLVDAPAAEGELVTLDHELVMVPEDADFLIIRTGFCHRRGEEVYWKNNPGLDPELAGRLRQRCPRLRVVGMDLISVSGYQNREVGRAAHRAFLLAQNILLVEDMDLRQVPPTLHSLICFPLLLDKADGAPVTILAETDV